MQRKSVLLICVVSTSTFVEGGISDDMISSTERQSKSCPTSSEVCNNRGSMKLSSSGVCWCNCTHPYFGLRCEYDLTNRPDSMDCSITMYQENRERCHLAAEFCFWSTTEKRCAQRRVISVNNSSGTSEDSPEHVWCLDFYPTPFRFVVYALALFTFSFSLAGLIYIISHRHIKSRVVPESGQIVFNRFFAGSDFYRPVICLVACLVVSVLVGISVLWHYLDYTNCFFVVIFGLFLLVVLLCLLSVIVMRVLQWCVARTVYEDLPTMDAHVMPPRQMTDRNFYTNTVRLF